jgi:hypothetical protein
MSSTHTPTFRVELHESSIDRPGVRYSPTMTPWPTKHAGRPTDATLAAYVESLEESTLPGGVNDHLGRTVVNRARVIRQATGELVAEYAAPAFRAL